MVTEKSVQGNKVRLTITMDKNLFGRVSFVSRGRPGRASGVICDCVEAHLGVLEARKASQERPDLVDRLVEELTKPEVLGRAVRIASACAGKDIDPLEADDFVRNPLDSLSRDPDPSVSEKATSGEEMQQIVKELLSPELVSEAMKIERQKSEAGEDILKSRSKRKGKASA